MVLGRFDGLDASESRQKFVIVCIALFSSIIALIAVGYLAFIRVLKAEKGDKKMVEIADNIKISAKAFLITEYKAILIFVVVFVILIAVVTDEDEILKTVISFLLGSSLSGLTGYIGMLVAVEANVRTANAAKIGLNEALQIAFGSGGVMGLSVVSISTLGLIIVYGIWGGLDQHGTRYLAGYGFGASSIALFARVGGGIYTKAADVGADLVGKVESDIPEDDPRNPATIADNVGDNVGDVAGMGADLFESFMGAIIASIQLAQEAYDSGKFPKTDNQRDLDLAHFVALPLWVTGFGIISSVIGIFLVRTSNKASKAILSHDNDAKNNDNDNDNILSNKKHQKDAGEDIQELLLFAIRRGIFTAAFLSWILSLITCGIFFGFRTKQTYKLWGCISIGLFAGELIGYFTEYYTSFVYKPTRSIAKKSRIGSAGVIIHGLGIGMISTAAPVIIICISIIGCYELAGHYGIGIAAVGMLSTLGATLSTDAFGPVADNAGGIAEMSELDPEIRKRTDGLDALGNTTAATGKGFCIGSAVLATLALLAAYKNEVDLEFIDISNSNILTASIYGACLPYLFSALTMMAVGRASSLMIEEVRRQFREYKLLSDNPTQKPDYAQCVAISTKASLIEMIIPGVLAVTSPLAIGYLLGSASLGGMLTGAVLSGFMLAVFMANSGGAWDNAKKWIEAERLGIGKGKGTEYHKAAIVGDTIGDPFKDTAGPSLDILIKLMTMMALLFGTSFSKDSFDTNKFFIGIIVIVVFVGIASGLWYWMRKTGFGKINYDMVRLDEVNININDENNDENNNNNNKKEKEMKENDNKEEEEKDNDNNNNNNNNNNNKKNEIELQQSTTKGNKGENDNNNNNKEEMRKLQQTIEKQQKEIEELKEKVRKSTFVE